MPALLQLLRDSFPEAIGGIAAAAILGVLGLLYRSLLRQDRGKPTAKGDTSRVIHRRFLPQLLVAIIAAAVVFLVGYRLFVPPEDANFKQFVGRVIDAATEQRIRGAKVSLEAEGVPRTLYTDSEGIVAFRIESRINNIRLKIEKLDYEQFDKHIDVSVITGTEDIRVSRILPQPASTQYTSGSPSQKEHPIPKGKQFDSICPDNSTDESPQASFSFTVFPNIVDRGGTICITPNRIGTFKVFLQVHTVNHSLKVEMVNDRQFITKIPEDVHLFESYIYVDWYGQSGELKREQKLIIIK